MEGPHGLLGLLAGNVGRETDGFFVDVSHPEPDDRFRDAVEDRPGDIAVVERVQVALQIQFRQRLLEGFQQLVFGDLTRRVVCTLGCLSRCLCGGKSCPPGREDADHPQGGEVA